VDEKPSDRAVAGLRLERRRLKNERPWVTINVAMTVDGKIDTAARRGVAISSAGDWERVDRLRAESDAVLVGGGTLLGEDPRLTVKSAALRDERRSRGQDANPAKVAIVSEASLSPDSRFLTHGPARVLIFTTGRTTPAQIAWLRKGGAEVFVLGERRVDLPAAMRTLYELGIRRVLVEGGGTLNAALLRLGLVDELFVYVAPLIFAGADAPTIADGTGLAGEDAIRLRLRSVAEAGEGAFIAHYDVTHT